MNALIVVAMLGAAVLAAPTCARNSSLGRYKATATLEILPPVTLDVESGARAETTVPYDIWLATQLELVNADEFACRAVKQANLASQPDFAGRTEAEIARMLIGHIEAQRRPGTCLVDITVVGNDPRVLDELANAAAWGLTESQRAEARRQFDDIKSRLEERIANNDSHIHLLMIDRTGQLQGANLTETAFRDGVAIGARRREEYALQIDVLTRRLIDAEAAGASAESRKAIEKQRDGYTAELVALRMESVRLEATKRIVDAKDEEIAECRRQRRMATMELERFAERQSDRRNTARVVSVAAEPSTLIR